MANSSLPSSHRGEDAHDLGAQSDTTPQDTEDHGGAHEPNASTWPTEPHRAPEPCPGSIAGYEIQGRLGEGGMGVVYRAFDPSRQRVVALKTLQRLEPKTLYRFKQEFRTLAGVSHPNLVQLYELVAEADHWALTMELVEGLPFHNYVQRRPPEQQMQSLRHVLRQLSEGLNALHHAGILHRDIKPSNVLVTRQGRVVLLDFGLAAEVGETGLYQSSEMHVVGTFAYMSPEQASAQAVGKPTDWYSVGVMLYLSLTGQLPFVGSLFEILEAKRQGTLTPPRGLVPTIPEDLNQLCLDLLNCDPKERPTGTDVLARLGPVDGGTPGLALSWHLPKQPLLFIGRERHQQALVDAFSTVLSGHPVVVGIHGESGMGKSTLIQSFLNRVTLQQEAVVLAGRCYERESVPYKALDPLVDALSHHLSCLPEADVLALLPRDVSSLIRVFPVLQRVGAVRLAPQRAVDIPDAQELRRRALASLVSWQTH